MASTVQCIPLKMLTIVFVSIFINLATIYTLAEEGKIFFLLLFHIIVLKIIHQELSASN